MTSIFQAGQPFNIVRTSSTTYQANDKDLVISSGDEVALPSPNQGATILVRPAPSIGSVKITTSNGTIGNTGDTFGFYRATEPIYLVGDGTDWYARSGGGEISAIPDSGISRWTLDDDDTDNGKIIDVWNGYNGSIDGATTGIQGPTVTYDAGEAYSFDGDNDKVTLPTFSESKWSIAAWSYWPESSSKNDASIGWGSTDGGGGESRIQFRSDRIRTYVNGSSYNPTFTEELDTWKFYTLTCDGSGYTYYIDGSKYDDSNLSTNLSEFDNHEIGKVSFKDNIGTKGNYTKCEVSDYRIYKKSLTPTEVSNLYTTGSI